jgi:uncharacterized protein DUF6265
MRNLIPFVLFLASMLAAPQDSAPAKKDPTLKDLGWIAGSWEGKVGRFDAEEHWTKPAGGTMIGMGRVLSGDRTVVFEYLRVLEKKGGIVYVAQPKGSMPVEFKLTKCDADSVTFENPEHDNPKLIYYKKTKDGISARTEGDEGGKKSVVEFNYTRMK